MATKERLTRKVGNYTRGFASEDGRNFRTEHQDLTPVKKHVEFLQAKVNEAPTVGNKNGWHFAGSIPTVVLTDWLNKHQLNMNDFATNRDDTKTKFMAYLRSEMPAFLGEHKRTTFAVS